MSYKTKIDQLLETPRIYWMELDAISNNVAGLIDLCKKYIKKSDHGVEHGSFSGVSSRVIALHCEKLDCVDPWSWAAVKEAEKMFDKILVDYPNITKVKLTGTEAAKSYEDHSLDFVYIDADHTYSAVVEDINTWKSKIKQGGYIAGHDSYMPEVLNAVKDCLGEPIETFSDTSWIFQL
jgi:predicted O-methyltransferase YrrM